MCIQSANAAGAWRDSNGAKGMQVGRSKVGRRDRVFGTTDLSSRLSHTCSSDVFVKNKSSRGAEERGDVLAIFVDGEVTDNPLSMPAHKP